MKLICKYDVMIFLFSFKRPSTHWYSKYPRKQMSESEILARILPPHLVLIPAVEWRRWTHPNLAASTQQQLNPDETVSPAWCRPETHSWAAFSPKLKRFRCGCLCLDSSSVKMWLLTACPLMAHNTLKTCVYVLALDFIGLKITTVLWCAVIGRQSSIRWCKTNILL